MVFTNPLALDDPVLIGFFLLDLENPALVLLCHIQRPFSLEAPILLSLNR